MIKLAFRWAAIFAIAPVLLGIISNHDRWGMKGTCVPLPTVAICICLAAGAAFICKRCWLTVASPFVAGIAGAFCTGPYGGILGLLVGLIVALLPFGKTAKSPKLSNCDRTPETP